MRDSKSSTYFTHMIAGGLRNRHSTRQAQHVESASSDPIETLWQDFTDARACAQKLTLRQQAIESVMVERIGTSVVHIERSDGGHGSATAFRGAEEILDENKGSLKHCEAENVLIETPQSPWSVADDDLGYSAALRAEARALDHVRDLAERLWRTPAASLTGVIAKLDALLSEGAPSSVAQEFPWPQLRAIRSDLEHLRVTSPPPSRR
jgi:hypothetical protein